MFMSPLHSTDSDRQFHREGALCTINYFKKRITLPALMLSRRGSFAGVIDVTPLTIRPNWCSKLSPEMDL